MESDCTQSDLELSVFMLCIRHLVKNRLTCSEKAPPVSNYDTRRLQSFQQLHNNNLLVCGVRLLSGSLHVIISIFQLHCVVRRSSLTDLSGKQMMLKYNVVLYTVDTVTSQPCPCVHFPLWDKDIFQTQVIRHSRELSLRREVEGSDKDECPTNAISSSFCVSSGT